MASIQQFFVTLNAATPDLFARFHKRTDRHLLRQAINPSAAMLRSGLKTRVVTITYLAVSDDDEVVGMTTRGATNADDCMCSIFK